MGNTNPEVTRIRDELSRLVGLGSPEALKVDVVDTKSITRRRVVVESGVFGWIVEDGVKTWQDPQEVETPNMTASVLVTHDGRIAITPDFTVTGALASVPLSGLKPIDQAVRGPILIEHGNHTVQPEVIADVLGAIATNR